MDDAIPISPERLLEETHWLRSLARSLAGPDEADDLAQEAWLRAVEQEPERIRGLRPWLRTVLRRAMLGTRASDAARRKREQAASRPEATASAAELAARASLHRTVVDAVLALDEPGRSTVLLRFFGDLMPREIARIQGVSLEAVRTRLRRALATLRAKLDRELGGREAWVLLAAPALVETGGVATAAAGTGAAVKLTLLGALLMTLKTKVGIVLGCVLLLAIGGVLWWKGGAQPGPKPLSPPSAPREEPRPTPTPAAPPPAAKINPRRSAPESAATAAAAPAPAIPAGKARLEIRIVHPDLGPVAGKAIDLVLCAGACKPTDEFQIGTALESSKELTRLGLQLVELKTDGAGIAACEVPSETAGCARVRMKPPGPRGAFLQTIEWLAVMPVDPILERQTLRLPDVVLPRRPTLVAGRVETESREPVEDAAVFVGRGGPVGEVADQPDLAKPATVVGDRTGADGRFRVEADVPAATYAVWAHVGRESASDVVQFVPGESDLVLRLRSTGGIEGRVRTEPHLQGVVPHLSLVPQGPRFANLSRLGRLSRSPDLRVDEKTGRVFQEGIPAGSYSLVVRIGIAKVLTIPDLVVEPGKICVDPRLADLVIGAGIEHAIVRVVSDGRPVDHAKVLWRPSSPDGPIRMTMTDYTNAAGEVSLPLPANAAMTISVEAPGFRPWSGKEVKFPLTVTLDSGANAIVHLPGARDLALPEGVNRYALALVPATDVASAATESRNVIPPNLRESQAQWIAKSDDFRFRGIAEGAYVAFVVPVSFAPGRSISAGDRLLFPSDVRSLEIGRLEVKSGAANEFTLTVNPAELTRLSLK